jgi:hypothetical protein
MMHRLERALAAALACGALALPVPARGEDARLPVLRHLEYKLSVSVTGKTEGKIQDAIQTFGTGSARAPKQGDVLTVMSNASEEGRIVADVMAATKDGGLVVDVSEEARSRSRRVVRVGVHANGRLDFPPNAEMSEEEGFLLRFLAREIAPAHLEPGSVWNIDENGADYVWRTNFRVIEMKRADDVRLALYSSLTDRKIGSTSVASSGIVDYDPSMDVPLSMQIDTRTLQQNVSSTTTTNLSVRLEVVVDSFRKTLQ